MVCADQIPVSDAWNLASPICHRSVKTFAIKLCPLVSIVNRFAKLYVEFWNADFAMGITGTHGNRYRGLANLVKGGQSIWYQEV